MSRWTADDIPDQAGRTFIVTGANSGLGYITTRELARRGAHVVMAVRNEARGEEALEKLRVGQPEARLEVRRLDLSDLDSVSTFAKGVIADGIPVDVLVNNAGIMMPPRSLTAQGFEVQFGVNHLAHFALTGLLLDVLAAGSGGRVVTVSSALHKKGSIHWDNLNGERRYFPVTFYTQSKFANILFGLELDRRLRASAAPVRSLMAHPGYAATNLQSAGPTGLLNLVLKITNRFIAKDAGTGALSQLYAATHPDAEGGQFIGPGERGESKGYPTVVQPVKTALDPDAAERLWGLSEELTGVRYHFVPAT
ncbi:oxidoreductase [Candidatus Protofrankia californiensis]|uniref:oxidoreductase n=1 Tax=Candidatus Protofrankia californiensis TaxID=1839754 RepID=UPI0010417A81|nr:oxidoreductase [Candidatus Protofrankia californiensis]